MLPAPLKDSSLLSAEDGQYPKESQSPFNIIVVGLVSAAGCLHPVSHHPVSHHPVSHHPVVKTILPPPSTNHSATRVVSRGAGDQGRPTALPSSSSHPTFPAKLANNGTGLRLAPHFTATSAGPRDGSVQGERRRTQIPRTEPNQSGICCCKELTPWESSLPIMAVSKRGVEKRLEGNRNGLCTFVSW